jgi:hypothetical protein
MIEAIKSTNPSVTSENKVLSDDINTWLNSSRNMTLMGYLYNIGRYRRSLYVSNFVASYSKNMAERLKQKNLLDGDPQFN